MYGLLLAMMNPPLESEAAFNAWYDDEHVPNRVGLDGFLSAKRFAAAEPAGPRYLATYELESLDVLAGEPYRNVVAERSARERDMLARIPLIDRRVYEPVLDGEPWTAEPPYVLLVAMTPRVGGEDDFVSWYREEHIRLLLAVRGWRRVRLFRQLEGDGPAFLAVHELESPNVFDEPAYQAAISTPWRGRIRSSVTRYERNLFKLRHSFL